MKKEEWWHTKGHVIVLFFAQPAVLLQQLSTLYLTQNNFAKEFSWCTLYTMTSPAVTYQNSTNCHCALVQCRSFFFSSLCLISICNWFWPSLGLHIKEGNQKRAKTSLTNTTLSFNQKHSLLRAYQKFVKQWTPLEYLASFGHHFTIHNKPNFLVYPTRNLLPYQQWSYARDQQISPGHDYNATISEHFSSKDWY